MRRESRQVAITVLAALAGLCAAVALAILTSDLSSQRIGLAGESPTAGRKLVAPARTTTTTTTTRRRRTTSTAAPAPILTTSAPATPTTTPTPSTTDRRDDSLGSSGSKPKEPDHDSDD